MTEEEITPAMFEAGNNAQHPDDCTDVRAIYRAMRDAIAGEARSGETVKQGSTGTASTRADRHRTTSVGHLLHKRSD